MKKNVYLFQPQYSVDLGIEKNYWIPYSVGCIWSYAYQFEDIQQNFICKDIFFKRDPHALILAKMESPVVCAFSCYQWNRTYNLELAKAIKQNFPDCVIVFGGPEINGTYLKENFIDCIIMGEGEINFLNLLRDIISERQTQTIYQKSRVVDLDTLPSPYTSGVFDSIVKDNPDIIWATTIETNRGCPFGCTFCDWGSLTYSKVKKFEISRIEQDLEWVANNPVRFLFCADANFGIFKDRDLEIAKLVSAAAKRSKYLDVFNPLFNKNNNEWSFKILKELGDLNRGFTVSVQSMNPDTLKAIKRANLGINDLSYIFELCEQNQVVSYTELILGLPLETKQSFIDGIFKLMDLGQHRHIEIWLTDLLVNSELATPEYMSRYGIKTVTTKDFFTLNPEENAYQEPVDIVCATNTMTTSEMVDSLMFGWFMINFHIQGYTQLTARFYNKLLGISWQTFYNTLYQNLQRDTAINDVLCRVRNIFDEFLHFGTLPQNIQAHSLAYTHAYDLYSNRQKIYHVLDLTVRELVGDHYVPDIQLLQPYAIFDLDGQYPVSIQTDIDIENFMIAEPKTYTVDTKITKNIIENFKAQYYYLRKKGILKNIFTRQGNDVQDEA
jgi:hypothetical protein